MESEVSGVEEELTDQQTLDMTYYIQVRRHGCRCSGAFTGLDIPEGEVEADSPVEQVKQQVYQEDKEVRLLKFILSSLETQ